MPEFNEGSLTVGAVTIPGTSLSESDQLGTALEKILLTVPEVASTARRTGRAELDEHVQGVESAEIDVDLKMANRSKAEVLQEIRRAHQREWLQQACAEAAAGIPLQEVLQRYLGEGKPAA